YRLWVQRIIWILAWYATHLMRVEVKGSIPTAPCIIVSNHLHNIDTPLAGRYAIRFGERVHWLAKAELFRIPLLCAILRAMQTVMIDREHPDRDAIQTIIHYARADKVWIFPEGHRSHDRRLQHGKEGVALIARIAHVPIVPIGITGTEHGLFPLLLQRQTLRISIGEPFTLPHQLTRTEILEYIMNRIEALLPEAYRRI
ncbi:MAG: 1-acyl-sn-glycerol-3-phosphate acyltransferase, partial [Chloroflexi bacterium]|nr:1-acyl-sn-glycerol-3-phosphate acyltransferase [Chloroflexota bacterium]